MLRQGLRVDAAAGQVGSPPPDTVAVLVTLGCAAVVGVTGITKLVLPPAALERFRRDEIAAQARAQQEQDDLTGAYSFTQPAKEKAPGLATEGSIFFREKEA